MPLLNTVVLSPTPRGLRAAAGLLRAGELVAFPTETVYGLGADARSDRAVAGIYEAKGRPSFNPLIVHVADAAAAAAVAELDGPAARLAEAFWPGPLTLVLPRRTASGLAERVTAGLSTVAVRVPAHPLARDLLAAFGGPLAGPSANPSGRVSPTTAAHVLDGLRGRVSAVIDAGPCPVGVESTIVGFEDGAPVLLRPGGLPAEAIAALLGQPLRARAGSAVTAPGQLASHYAPAVAVRLDATAPRPGELWLGFGPGPDAPGLNLSPTGDLAEAATVLFAHLRALDERASAEGAQGIAVAPIPREGLGAALNDRLSRAAAPRD
ncbi:L-threonylcarbamoyladenylate synthase [Amaricoccus macauensis]|uniref:Threonylcarbamoyl-AMP synthase n=1 Tax=Amaricoccus macauensis TaxID=57001 RepID=A0A840SP76_9RHOB|nr:L-threonylcarbamoyladenylate synthase [Amaricoccus macauensis]MBB5221101.1 L-threonylcarbamoyladenylate synthase [Amaricoccus macauensis]